MDNYRNIQVNNWGPTDFKLETNSVWSFPNRGNWACHNGRYRGNWSPYIPRNVILRYSKKGDVVLDQFMGSGTTLIETILLDRKGIGVDINPRSVEIYHKNISKLKLAKRKADFYIGDARNLNFIKNDSIDLICTHPPYANIINYSKDIKGDLSNYSVNEFLVEMNAVAEESYRILKKGRFCAIMMGDTRINRNIVPLGFKTMEIFTRAGFTLKEIIIKEQHNCKNTDYWKKRSIQYNFLLIAHEYLFVFTKN